MEEPIEQPKKNSLAGLVILAQYHSIAVDEGDITHRFSTESNSIDQTAWLLAAKDIGLKARVIKQKTDRLHLLTLPALVWRDDGEHFILAKIDEDRFLIHDLGLNKPVVLDRKAFEERYSGIVICVTSRASVLGGLAKFDFTWFIPSLVKYRRIITEVIIMSIVIQLFALITPLFFQVVMDKVLVHRSFSTLDVIAVAFVGVIIFEIVLGNL